MSKKANGSKAERLVLSKETVAALRVRSGVNTGMKILSVPVGTCVSKIPALCPEPPKSGNGACF